MEDKNRKEEILGDIALFAEKMAVREDVQQSVDCSDPVWELAIWEMVLTFEEALRQHLPLRGEVVSPA